MRFLLILCFLIMGCTTISQPDKTAVYHTKNGIITEPNTETDQFFDRMLGDETLTGGEYWQGKKVIKWTND